MGAKVPRLEKRRSCERRACEKTEEGSSVHSGCFLDKRLWGGKEQKGTLKISRGGGTEEARKKMLNPRQASAL